MGKEIYLTIKDIVKNLTDEEYEMKMENSFVDDLGFDSVNLLYLQVAVEDEFDIKNLKNLCECVERKLGD